MLYQKYKNRISSFAKFLMVVKRYKVIILSVLCGIMVTSGTLMGLTGTVIGDSGISQELVFGEQVRFEANSFLASSNYEFYDFSTGEWSEEIPEIPGKYKVRAKSLSIFGNVRYGDEHDFTIKPKAVSFAVSEDEIVYGETPTVSTIGDNTLVKNSQATCVDYEYLGLGTDSVFITPNKEDIKIFRAEEDITAYYDISVEPKQVEIKSRTVKITVDDDTCIYDGKTYTADKYTITEGNFVDGDQVDFSFSGSIVNVGEITTSAQLESAVNSNGDDVFRYYDVEITDGKFTITQRPLNVLTQTVERVYSGREYVYEDYQIDQNTPVVDGEEINYNKASITDVGFVSIKDQTKVLITKTDGENSTSNYKIEFPGDTYVKVTAYQVDITSASNVKVYDGTPLSADTLLLQDGIVLQDGKYVIQDTGDVITPTFGASATDFSTVDNDFTVEIKKPSGANAYGNYTVKLHAGTLSIEKRTIAFNTKSYSWVYNATAQKDEYSYLNSDLILSDGETEYYELLDGHLLKTATYTEITDVKEGEILNELTFTVESATENFSKNYEIKILQKGVLKILPAPINVATETQTWTYDGDDHSSKRVIANGLFNNHKILWDGDLDTLTTVRDVLKDGDMVVGVDNVFNFVILDDSDNDQTDNYAVIENGYAYGKLIIKPRPINLTTASNSWVYDGVSHTDTTFAQVEEESQDRGLLAEKGHQAKYKEDGCVPSSVFDVTSGIENVFDVVIEGDGEDKTFNYDLTVNKGTLSVTVRHIKIESNTSLENIYNDSPFKANGYTLTCLEDDQTGAIPECDQLTVVVKGFRVDVGSSLNTFAYDIIRKDGEISSRSNYAVEEVEGVIEVLPRPITIKTGTEEWTYDGKEHYNTQISATNLVENHQICWNGNHDTLTKTTDVVRGENNEELSVANEFEFTILKSGHNVTSNYVVEDGGYYYGELTIRAKEVLVFTASNEWEYDGEEHYDFGVESFDLVLGHSVFWDGNEDTITKTTNVKRGENNEELSVYNEFGIIITGEDGDKTHNYDAILIKGELIIRAREIIVTTADKEWVYCAEDLSYTEDVSADRLVNGHYVKYDGKDKTQVQDVTSGEENIYQVLVFNENDQDITYNYDIIDYVYGKLIVTARPVDITTASNSWVYDGRAHFDATFESVEQESEDRGLLADKGHQAEYKEDGIIPTTVFDVTEQENVFDVIITAQGEDKTFNYEINLIKGTLKVTKRHIEIFSSGSAGNVYDGTVHRADGYQLFCLEEGETVAIPECDQLDVTITGYQEDVGTSPNTFTYTIIRKGTGLSSADNYQVKETCGTIEVIPREIKVQTGTKEFVFDGNVYDYTDYAVVIEGSLVLDHKVEYNDGYKTQVRNVSRDENGFVISVDNVYEVRVVSANGEKTKNYKITYDYGKLTVTPINALIFTATTSWIYDGEEHSDVSVVDTVGLLQGHTAWHDGGAFVTVLNAVDVKDNEFKVNILSSYGNETVNYEISYDYGVLSIDKREITAKLVDAEKVYEGIALTSTSLSFEWTYPEKTVYGQTPEIIGHEYIADAYGEQLFVGTSENVLLGVTVKCKGQDVSENYDFKYENGLLTVLVRPISIRPADREKTYDGTPLVSDNSFWITSEYGIAWGDTLSIVAPGEITKVGELQYYITEYAFMRDGVDVSWNYDVDYLEHGTLKINPKPITIISGSNTRMYDGTPIISHELVGDATFDGTNFRIVDTNEIITASFTGWQIEVEEVSENNYFTIDSIVDKDGEDSMGNYVITTKNGTLKATPRPITVNTGSKIFTFDKQTHYYSDCPTAGGYGLVLDHVVAYDGGERTEVRNVSRDAGGQVIGVANCYQVRVLSAEGDKTHNYQISYDNGSITILPIDVTVVTATNSWDYDGEIHFDTNIVSYSGFLDGDTPYYDELGTTEVRDVLYDSNGRVVGKANIFGVKVISSDDLDETVNYEITYDYGTLTINAIEINIKPIDMEKYYDGTPLINENGEFEYLDDVRLPSGVSISIETDGYFVGPGKTEYNIIAYEITKDGQPVGSNYIVNVYPGTLKVIKEITITTESAEKVYDGVALTDDRVYVEGSTIEGEYLIVTVIGSQTDAGESENDCLIEIVDANGEIIDGAVDKYEWLFDYGTLKVTKRSVFYSSPSDIKFYDGVEFYNDQMEFMPHDGDTGLLPNHQIVALVTTRILYPGVEDNLIEAFSVECDGRNVTDNYVLFVKEVGTLEVTGRLITVTTENDIKAYDGAPLENSNYSYEGDLLEGHQVVVEVTGSQTEIGESDNTAIVDIIDQNGKSVMDLYAVKVETGTLTVMPEDGGLPDGSVPSSGKGQQDGEYKDVEWYKVLSSKDGRIYLRMTSYGDYDGQGWGDAVNYQGSTSISPLGYASLALANAGMAFDTVTISKMFTGAPYVLPYYVDARTLGNRNDAFVNNPGQTYNLNYVLARDLAEIVEMLPNASLPIQYRYAEELYRKHVHETYLQLPEYTKEEMLKVIERHNLDANNPEILLQVAELVQRQVAYSKTFSYEGDIAVYFFNGAETGICSHYSTAATALFRALGIPARYVGGITGEVTAGEESIISGELHAWVEVYIDGVGWIQVEVTGSGDGSGGSGGSGENEGEGSEGENGENGGNGGSGNNGAGNAGNGGNGKQEFYIKPVDVIEKFVSVGTVVYAEQKVESSKENLVDCFAEFKKEGYTWEFRVEGQLIATQEGVDFEGESNIVYFVLYDRNGNILFSTDNNPDDNQIIINMLPGSILITNKDIVELYLFYKEKVYSGNTVSYSPDEYYIKEKPDFIGEIVFNLQGSLSTPGTLLIEDLVNESTFKAYDLDGNLLVYGEDYVVEVIGTPLTITRRSITISSSSASFKYNGKEQTANSQKDATITMGSLIDGHTMKVTISGAITDVGTKENTIESVVIFDAQGNNVTDYYNIILKPGTLVVY